MSSYTVGTYKGSNPNDSSGNTMACHGCGSTEHLIARCPDRKGGKGKGKRSFFSSSSDNDWWEQQSQLGYYVGDYSIADGTSTVRIEDLEQTTSNPSRGNWRGLDTGSSDMLSRSTTIANPPKQFWPVWSYDYHDDNNDHADLAVQYHVKTRLSSGNREGLLIDPGALLNLCGDKWASRQQAIAAQHGRHVVWQTLQNPIRVEGVGKGGQSCAGEAIVPICLRSHTGCSPDASYKAAYIQGSEIPALLGLDTLTRMRCVLDCYNGVLFQMGDGDFHINLPPGSQRFTLERAQSGHWILPCSDWPSSQTK